MDEAPLKPWSMASAIEQLEKCNFECEAGPLQNNDAYRWLVNASRIGPEFWPGQGVWFKVTTNVVGIKFSKWSYFWVVGCQMESDSDRRFWTYDLSYDPPAPYHYGTVQFTRIRGEQLRLRNPDVVLPTQK